MLHSTTVNLYRKRIQSNQENCIQEKTEYEGLCQRFTCHWVWAGHVAKNRVRLYKQTIKRNKIQPISKFLW